MKNLLLKLLLLFSFLSISISANSIEKTEQEFNDTFINIINIVKNTSLSKDERNKKIVDTIEPIFDFELMAKLSLGKTWKTLSKTQQNEFVTAYVNRMKTSYSSKIDGFADEKVVIDNIKQPKTTRLIMFTSLVGNGEAIKIDYKYYKTKAQKPNKKTWLIYDVNIKGISIIKTDRAQFKAFLRRESVDNLIKKMQ